MIKDENMKEWFKKLHEYFPFLTYGVYLSEDYIGIVQNADNQFITMYVYNRILDEQLRKKFLELGENWWWESNRKTPINIFLKDQFKLFKPYLRGFSRKEFDIKWGPVISLQDQMTKRIKRKQIELVKKV
jgi:hypothetical protein